MARRLRLYSHPLTARVGRGGRTGQEMESTMTGASASPRATAFIKYVPRNVSPISHVIIPQTTGLDPNAHLTPLKGYQIRFKGKILEKTLRSNTFKFRTGHTRKSDYRSHHYQEGYSVHGPFGSVGIRVYYEYDLEPYFGSNEIYNSHDQQQQNDIDNMNKTDILQQQKNDNEFHDAQYFDQYEDPHTQQLLLDADDQV